jgi:two-component system, OmpR family, KDP operon response regulator KdpE
MSQRILIVDDEDSLRRSLSISLLASGFEVLLAEDGEQALACFEREKPDLVLLDLGLPRISGLEVLKKIRAVSQTPIIILSVRNQERQKIESLDSGANDYLTKPFGVGELQARIRVALRNQMSSPDPLNRVVLGDLRMDTSTRQVWKREHLVKLTKTEYRVLELLIQHAGKVLTHKQMLEAIWGKAYIKETHYLQVYVSQLRHKLEDDPTQPTHILTESGVGYRLASF